MSIKETTHYQEPKNIVIVFVGLLLVLLAIVGNSFVICAVKRKRSLRTTTNILLANVAVADLITSAFLPFIIVQRATSFPEGKWTDFLCKFVMDYHVPITASSASLLTLTIVAVERYHAIVKPMRSTRVRLREDTVKYAITAIWVVAISITLPLYIFGHYERGICKTGYPERSDFYGSFVIPFSVLIILLPLIIIFYCYLRIVKELYFKKTVAPQNNALAEADKRSKRQLIKVALTVTSVNTTCLLPFGIVGILRFFEAVPRYSFNICVAIFFLENALNPFLYSFQSSNFRQAFKEMLSTKS